MVGSNIGDGLRVKDLGYVYHDFLVFLVCAFEEIENFGLKGNVSRSIALDDEPFHVWICKFILQTVFIDIWMVSDHFDGGG